MARIVIDVVSQTSAAMRAAPVGSRAYRLARPIAREQVLIDRYRWMRDRTPSLVEYARADRTYALVVERLFADDAGPGRRESN